MGAAIASEMEELWSATARTEAAVGEEVAAEEEVGTVIWMNRRCCLMEEVEMS